MRISQSEMVRQESGGLSPQTSASIYRAVHSPATSVLGNLGDKQVWGGSQAISVLGRTTALHLFSIHFYAASCSVQFSCSVVSDSLWPHGLQHARPPRPLPTPGACSNSCPLNCWCRPTISSSVIPFSRLQSFPVSGSFPMSQSSPRVAKVLEFQLHVSTLKSTVMGMFTPQTSTNATNLGIISCPGFMTDQYTLLLFHFPLWLNGRIIEIMNDRNDRNRNDRSKLWPPGGEFSTWV